MAGDAQTSNTARASPCSGRTPQRTPARARAGIPRRSQHWIRRTWQPGWLCRCPIRVPRWHRTRRRCKIGDTGNASFGPTPPDGDPLTGLPGSFLNARPGKATSPGTPTRATGRDRGRGGGPAVRVTGMVGRELAAKGSPGAGRGAGTPESRRGEIQATVTSAPGMPPGTAERRAWACGRPRKVYEVIASPNVSGPLASSRGGCRTARSRWPGRRRRRPS